MIARKQCTLSFGLGIHVQWNETTDGTLHFSVRKTLSQGGIERLAVSSASTTWSHSEQKQSDLITINFQDSSGDVDDANCATEGSSPGDDHNKATDIKVVALMQKILDGLKKSIQKLKKNENLWSGDAHTFFGVAEYDSMEKFSYISLENDHHRCRLYRAPFHKIHLAIVYDGCFKAAQRSSHNILETYYRSSFLESLHPGYKELQPEQRKTISKRFGRNIASGKALRWLSQGCLGRLLTVGPNLTTADHELILDVISKNPTLFDPLLEQTLEASKDYNSLASKFLSYLQPSKRRVDEGLQISAKRRRFPDDPVVSDPCITQGIPVPGGIPQMRVNFNPMHTCPDGREPFLGSNPNISDLRQRPEDTFNFQADQPSGSDRSWFETLSSSQTTLVIEQHPPARDEESAFSSSRVRSGVTRDQPVVEAMTPPSAIMEDHWGTGEWDLFQLSHSSPPNGDVGTGTEINGIPAGSVRKLACSKSTAPVPHSHPGVL